MKKDVYWEPALEDSLDLTAKLPVIAAFIYRYKYLGKKAKPRYNPTPGLRSELRPHDRAWRIARAMPTSPGCISSCTPIMNRATSARTRRTWSARRSRISSMPLPRA